MTAKGFAGKPPGYWMAEAKRSAEILQRVLDAAEDIVDSWGGVVGTELEEELLDSVNAMRDWMEEKK